VPSVSRGGRIGAFLGITGAGLAAFAWLRYRRDLRRAHERVSAGSRIVETPCRPIEYGVAGDGPPVLAVHGAGGFAAPAAGRGIVRPAMSATWSCPKCTRRFRRKNQRHACGTGSRQEVLRGRPEPLVALYRSLESFAETLGFVEFVARDRYVLLRTSRIFADLVVMKDALRVAVHLGRRVADPVFFKVGEDRKRVTHVAMLRDETGLSALKPYLREAYGLSVSSPSA
jgi:hypothetical protein